VSGEKRKGGKISMKDFNLIKQEAIEKVLQKYFAEDLNSAKKVRGRGSESITVRLKEF
jgi:hypothetical protein